MAERRLKLIRKGHHFAEIAEACAAMLGVGPLHIAASLALVLAVICIMLIEE